MEPANVIILTCQELDDIVRTRMAPLTDNPQRYEKWDSITEFEWGNDESHRVKAVHPEGNKNYQKHAKLDIMTGTEKKYLCSLEDLFSFLVENNIVIEATYLVDVIR